MQFQKVLPLVLCLWSAACSPSSSLQPNEREVKVPNGTTLVVELLTQPEDMARGMMYRDALPSDRGMLFAHNSPGRYPYWMHNVKIPLDIMWLDRNRTVVEINANTPPCDGKPAADCPAYGGKQESLFVLELAGGMAARYNITEGTRLDF
jgi:uncharacterized membrane protein (UPF0127 family)